MRSTCVLIALLVAALAAPAARGDWIPTNFGIGADAEVRESASSQARGTSTEIASRVRNDAIAGAAGDSSDRNSAIYTKFDLTGYQMPADGKTAFRMTHRNSNLTGSRIQDVETPNPAIRTGLAIYGLDPNAEGASWDEATISYDNAPGLTPDGDVGTKDFNSALSFLGTVAYPDIGTQNHLPVGDELVFQSGALNQFVSDALNGGSTELTLVSTVIHNGDAPFASWINFNYLFNPKEQITLNDDPSYDADVTDEIPAAGSPWSGADNSTGLFSPSILLAPVPEPSSLLLSVIALLGVAGLRRRI